MWYAHHPAVTICTTDALRLRPNKPPPVAAWILGTGNFTVFPPTPGYYIEGGEAIDIHEITVTEREALHPSSGRSVRRPRRGAPRPASLSPGYNGGATVDRSNQEHSGVGRANQKRLDKVYEHGKRIHDEAARDTKAQTSGNWGHGRNGSHCSPTSTQPPT